HQVEAARRRALSATPLRPTAGVRRRIHPGGACGARQPEARGRPLRPRSRPGRRPRVRAPTGLDARQVPGLTREVLLRRGAGIVACPASVAQSGLFATLTVPALRHGPALRRRRHFARPPARRTAKTPTPFVPGVGGAGAGTTVNSGFTLELNNNVTVTDE